MNKPVVRTDGGMPSDTGREGDHLTVDIACLNPGTLHATLVSSVGSHCEVWRTSRRGPATEQDSPYLEFVLKYPRGSHSLAETKMLARHYRLLKGALDDIVPNAIFFLTSVGGRPNVCVIAEAVNVWFNIANPQNREEAIGLLEECPKARSQLARFVDVAVRWRASADARLLDLFGVDNLIMDSDREIRYLDSFFVFFFEDMLDLLHEPDDELAHRIRVSRERLLYLEDILAAARADV